MRRLTAQSGFTIVEVMVAMVLLLVGVLGTVKLVDASNGLSVNTRAREGAIALSRQLIDIGRDVQYASITNTTLVPALQAQAGLADADMSQSGWQIKRRGFTYTVNVTACEFDSSKDGARSDPNPLPGLGSAYCGGSVAASAAGTDGNPDDFRRMSVDIKWRRVGGPAPSCAGDAAGTGANCVTQAGLIANPSGGLGPSIIPPITASPSGVVEDPTIGKTTFTFSTTSSADQVDWSVDDGISSNTANPVGTSAKNWTFDWTYPASTVDGTYTVTLQAFAFNSGGNPSGRTVSLNRFLPLPPDVTVSPAIGVDSRITPIVELAWKTNSERDILGYQVYRLAGGNGATPDLTTSSGDTLVCPSSKTTLITATNCFDSNPDTTPGTTSRYYVVAFDAPATNPTFNPTSTNCVWNGNTISVPFTPSSFLPNRAGCPSDPLSIDVNAAAGNAAPGPVTGLTVTTVAGLPKLDWNAPADPDILFYRIYRDPPAPGGTSSGTNYANRYARTADGAVTTYTDNVPAGSNTYYVTAVNSSFQESAPQSVNWP
jgi:prepilin-type N-terminal cleavage/methylation domain-containing protein